MVYLGMENFIKVYTTGSRPLIINLTSISIVKPIGSHSVLIMKDVDKDGVNIEIEDTVRSFETYDNLLVDKIDYLKSTDR
jgi:hypothetical protein